MFIESKEEVTALVVRKESKNEVGSMHDIKGICKSQINSEPWWAAIQKLK